MADSSFLDRKGKIHEIRMIESEEQLTSRNSSFDISVIVIKPAKLGPRSIESTSIDLSNFICTQNPNFFPKITEAPQSHNKFFMLDKKNPHIQNRRHFSTYYPIHLLQQDLELIFMASGF